MANNGFVICIPDPKIVPRGQSICIREDLSRKFFHRFTYRKYKKFLKIETLRRTRQKSKPQKQFACIAYLFKRWNKVMNTSKNFFLNVSSPRVEKHGFNIFVSSQNLRMGLAQKRLPNKYT